MLAWKPFLSLSHKSLSLEQSAPELLANREKDRARCMVAIMTATVIPFRQAECLHGTWTVWTPALLLPRGQSMRQQSPGLCFSYFSAMNSREKCHTFNPCSTENSLWNLLPCSLALQPLTKAASQHGILYPWLLVWVLASSLQDSTTTSGLGTDSTRLGWCFSPRCHEQALELLGHGLFNQDLVIIS